MDRAHRQDAPQYRSFPPFQPDWLAITMVKTTVLGSIVNEDVFGLDWMMDTSEGFLRQLKCTRGMGNNDLSGNVEKSTVGTGPMTRATNFTPFPSQLVQSYDM